MIKKIASIAIVFLGVNVFASTPVNQGSSFPSSPPNQKEAYEEYKESNKPADRLAGIGRVDPVQFDNKRHSDASSRVRNFDPKRSRTQ